MCVSVPASLRAAPAHPPTPAPPAHPTTQTSFLSSTPTNITTHTHVRAHTSTCLLTLIYIYPPVFLSFLTQRAGTTYTRTCRSCPRDASLSRAFRCLFVPFFCLSFAFCLFAFSKPPLPSLLYVLFCSSLPCSFFLFLFSFAADCDACVACVLTARAVSGARHHPRCNPCVLCVATHTCTDEGPVLRAACLFPCLSLSVCV